MKIAPNLDHQAPQTLTTKCPKAAGVNQNGTPQPVEAPRLRCCERAKVWKGKRKHSAGKTFPGTESEASQWAKHLASTLGGGIKKHQTRPTCWADGQSTCTTTKKKRDIVYNQHAQQCNTSAAGLAKVEGAARGHAMLQKPKTTTPEGQHSVISRATCLSQPTALAVAASGRVRQSMPPPPLPPSLGAPNHSTIGTKVWRSTKPGKPMR